MMSGVSSGVPCSPGTALRTRPGPEQAAAGVSVDGSLTGPERAWLGGQAPGAEEAALACCWWR